MAKRPTPGSSKTRLVPPLTHELAAELSECLVLDTLDVARSVPDAVPLVAVWPPDAVGYFAGIAGDVDQVIQRGASLDERLDEVLTSCLDVFGRVVAIGSDSPTLPTDRVGEAFDALDDESIDVVLGPADDGGYYLIGAKRPHEGLVRGVVMSTPTVLRDTLERARSSGVRVALLDPWYDVDELADLERLRQELAEGTDGIGRARHTVGFLRRLATLDAEADSGPDPNGGSP